MPVLLLARGDAEAKDRLRRAIHARYGFSPPAIDSLKIDFKGRVRARVGPINTWLPLDMLAQFRFPNAMRLDFTVRPVGVAVQRGIESFDGTTYRSRRGSSSNSNSNNPDIIADPEAIRSYRLRLWAIAAVLLTPLGEHFVELSPNTDNGFNAVNTLFDDAVSLQLRDDHTLAQVEVRCQNPDSGREARFCIKLSEDQMPVNHLMLPSHVSAFWDDTAYFEAEPVRVEANPTIADEVFTLQTAD